MVIPVLGSLSLMWVTQLGFWVLALAWPQPWVWRSLSGVQKVYAQGRVDGQIGQDRQRVGHSGALEATEQEPFLTLARKQRPFPTGHR